MTWKHWLPPLALAVFVLAQEPTAPPKPKIGDPGPEVPKPEPPKESPKPVYAYQGKPLKIDFQCKEDDIQNFGLTCTEDDPCDVYLELSAIDTSANRTFLTGNLHTRSATLWSILLMSEDGGKTWTEAYERMRSTGLEQIQFADFEVGWIGGQVLQALPRDPFFLITSDGGKSWRKRPVYSESRVGAVEQFAFENRTAGELLIDRTQTGDSGGRHEFYETTTGGDSWSLRQVSPKPILLKRPRTPNADWRIHPDAPTKSFRIEHRAGQRAGQQWSAAASFLVHVGACRAAEWKLAEPPPPEDPKPEEPPAPRPSAPKAPPSLKKKRP